MKFLYSGISKLSIIPYYQSKIINFEVVPNGKRIISKFCAHPLITLTELRFFFFVDNTNTHA